MDPIEDVNPDEEKKFPVKVGENVYIYTEKGNIQQAQVTVRMA